MIYTKKTYLTLLETLQFIDQVVDNCFVQDESGNDIDYTPQFKYPAIQEAHAMFYTDYQATDDIEANYKEYMAINMSDWNDFQFSNMLKAIDEQIEFRKQKLLNSQQKPVDEMFSMFTTLLTTLNAKAQELDVKKLDKIIKKLNPQEILKAYQKSGVGEGVRDKAIQDLAKENKELKNQISARNVMSGE